MSYATDILKEDFQAQRTEALLKTIEALRALENAKEGTHEHEVLTLKKEALETEYRLLEKLACIQGHYNFLREHAEQLVRYFNGN